MIVNVITYIHWICRRNGTIIFWALRGYNWKHFVIEKKWWFWNYYYIDGRQVSRYKWWITLFF